MENLLVYQYWSSIGVLVKKLVSEDKKLYNQSTSGVVGVPEMSLIATKDTKLSPPW
jgi:hypothetical protein